MNIHGFFGYTIYIHHHIPLISDYIISYIANETYPVDTRSTYSLAIPPITLSDDPEVYLCPLAVLRHWRRRHGAVDEPAHWHPKRLEDGEDCWGLKVRR